MKKTNKEVLQNASDSKLVPSARMTCLTRKPYFNPYKDNQIFKI